MSKIVRAFVVTHAPAAGGLIKAINEADGPGFLDRVRGAVGGFKNPEPKAKPEEQGPERATPGDADTSALSTIVSEIMNPPEGESRFVIFLTHTNLVSFYLKQGGGAALVDQLPDDELLAFATDPMSKSVKTKSGPRIVQMPPGYSFDKLVTPRAAGVPREAAVQLNIPNALSGELKGASGKIELIRNVLKKMMSHRYYVCTIAPSRAKSLLVTSEMATAKDFDEQKKKFNPNCIENYPVKAEFIAAKNEWYELHKEEEDKRRQADAQAAMRSKKETDAHADAEGKLAQAAAPTVGAPKGPDLSAVEKAYKTWSSQKTAENDKALRAALAKAFPAPTA
jgi:hypothetical protein